MTLWQKLESTPHAAAARAWRDALHPWFDAAQVLCLNRTGRSASRVPCPKNCGSSHTVYPEEAGFVAICDSQDTDCEDIPLQPVDVSVLEFNLPKLARAVASALRLSPVVEPLGVTSCVQIAVFGPASLPVVLTVASDRQQFHHTAAQLAVTIGKLRALITPTNRLWTPAARQTLSRASIPLLALENLLFCAPDGKLRLIDASHDPLGQCLPEPENAIQASEAQRIFVMVQKLRGAKPLRKASLHDVFTAIVLDGLTQRAAATRIGCVKGLIGRRVAELEHIFSMPIAQLRSFGSRLCEMNRSVTVRRRRLTVRVAGVAGWRGETAFISNATHPTSPHPQRES